MQSFNGKDLRDRATYILLKYWLFFVAFGIMALYLKQSGPMQNISGDAASIWETIKSIPSGKIVSSYVLYKGFASVYPYVWLYQLSLVFGVSEFVFVKLFHCILFAYVSAVGFPYIAEVLLKSKSRAWHRFLLILIMFWLWKSTYAFSQIMVDLPSLAYFILLINSALKIAYQPGDNRFLRFFYTGLLIGLNMSLSGQYSIAAICVLVYILLKIIPWQNLRSMKIHWASVLCVIILLSGLAVVKGYNTYFEKTFVDQLRSEGEWIPDDSDWLHVALYSRTDEYRWGSGPTIIDNRGLSILKDIYGDQFTETQDMINQGGFPISIKEYFQTVARYPMDYLMKYVNRLFISVSPDGGYLSVSRLFFAYSLLFVCFLSVFRRVKRVKDFFSTELLIYISFVLALAAVIVLTVEPRYVMQIQGLVFTFALLDHTLWDGFRSFGRIVRQCFIDGSIKSLWNRPFPYAFFVYLLFMMFCFAHIAVLYETIGIDPEKVLFRF